MAHKFTLNPESLKRRFAVYIVIAKGHEDMKLYVGKTGDNRDGCNPVISRCGNHFSYNKVHSQVRNKIPDHEFREYTYILYLRSIRRVLRRYSEKTRIGGQDQ